MKLSKIALAVVGLCAAAAVSAAPNNSRIALSGGASAIQGNLTLALRNLCTNAGGTPTNFVSGNFTTVVCANAAVTAATYASKPNAEFINMAGTPYAEYRVNVSNGSFGNIQILNGFPFTFRDPATGTNVLAQPGQVVIGGFNDVEPTAFPGTTIGTNTVFASTGAGVAQVFGVGATLPLYTKMFNAQQAAGLIPAAPTCTVNSTSVSFCVPSIAKAQFASIMVDNSFNAAYGKGLGFLTGVAGDDGVELRYVRRVDTSGTQSSAQNYFLGLPCSKAALPVVPEPLGNDEVDTVIPTGGTVVTDLLDSKIGNIRVMAAGGTADVRNELNKPGAAYYALGVLSGENNRTDSQWRWLRVDGATIGENAVPGTAGITNSNTMKNGSYSFYFETTFSGGNAANDAVLQTIANSLNTLTAPVGLVNAVDLAATYTKSGSTCLGSSSS